MIQQSDPVLKAQGLECVRNDIMLFSGLDLQLTSNEILQITGTNGSGKTSLLRIICGLAMPDRGSVFWNDKNILENDEEYLNEISYVGHNNGIKAELTLYENLEIARLLSKPRLNFTSTQTLEKFGLNGYEDITVSKLSSGQRRRVALARLLITDTRLWILDEPYTSMDEEGKQIVNNMIGDHINQGGMAVIATHEPVTIASVQSTTVRL